MSLFSLPCDAIRAILQRISLQDIARLLIAANCKSSYRILQEAIDTVQYEPQCYLTLPEGFYDWARKIGIHLTHIKIESPSCAQINYLHEMREFFQGIRIYRTNTNNDKVYKTIPLLLEFFPNLIEIISNQPLIFENMTAQQGLQLKFTAVSNCAILAELPILTNLECIDISLTTDEAEIIIDSCSKLKWMSTTFNNYDGLQYLMHSPLIELIIDSKIPTTPPLYVPAQYVTESNIVTLTVVMDLFDRTLIDIIADNCTKLKNLDIEVITGYYTAGCDAVIAKLLSNCKWLKKFSYQDNINNATVSKPAANLLYSLFNTSHGALASISVHQGTTPTASVAFNAILTPMPNLKKLYLDGSLPQSTLMLLSGCTSLVNLDYDSTISDSTKCHPIEVKLLYNVLISGQFDTLVLKAISSFNIPMSIWSHSPSQEIYKMDT